MTLSDAERDLLRVIAEGYRDEWTRGLERETWDEFADAWAAAAGQAGDGQTVLAFSQAFKDCNREGARVLVSTADGRGSRYLRYVGSAQVAPRARRASGAQNIGG